MTAQTNSSPNRQMTEHRILQAVAAIIAEQGFEKMGINRVAQKAGIAKVLIYRYFGSLDELIALTIFKQDYWARLNIEPQQIDNIPVFLKRLFHDQISQLRHDIVLKRLARWELSANNSITQQLREQRENNGCYLIKLISQLTQSPSHEIAALASILSSSISYLAMIAEINPIYNGIDLQTDAGWQQITFGIDMIIDLWVKHLTN